MDGSSLGEIPWGELELLREGLRAAGVGAWTWDVVGGDVRWSDNVAELFHVEPAAFASTYEAYLALLDADARELVTGAVSRCLSGASDSYLLVHPLDRPGVGRRWLECRGRVWRSADGKPTRMAGTVVDVTEKHVAAKRLAQEQAVLAGILAAGAVGVVVVDASLQVVLANPRAELLLGGPSGQFQGLQLSQLCNTDVDFCEQLTQLAQQAFDEAAPSFGHRLDRRVRERRQRLSVNVGPILAGAGRAATHPAGLAVSHVVIALDDHSELRDAQKERVDLQSQLDHARRLESVGRLAGGVAHDFNNLLTVILGYCDFAARRLKVDGPAADAFTQIADAAHKASDLTSQLLSFARRRPVEPEHIDVGKTVRALRELLMRTAGEGVRLRIRTPGESAIAYIDRTQFEQALINIAANARDAMPKGGTLDVLVTVGGASDAGDSALVCVSITDSGCGMDPQTASRALEPFFTTKARGAGTGLGLASADGFIRQAGGRLSLESDVGRGTRVDIALPRSFQPEAAPPRVDSLPPMGAGTVLLVEDTDAVRQVAARALSDHGYSVIEAGSGQQALGLLRLTPRIDAAVIDIVLPDTNGVELAAELRTHHPRLPLVFVSGYAEEHLARVPRDDGSRFLQKPYAPVGLVRAVRAAVIETKERGSPEPG